MNYPNGIRRSRVPSKQTNSYGNRGMALEEDINQTNQYYLDRNLAIIHKKPTPIQIVNVHYPSRSAAVITEGYFQQASTTDYNGLYKQQYIDFEAKETNSKTSLPLANFHHHQIKHIESIIEHGGISFVILRFNAFDETYLLPSEHLLSYWQDQQSGGRKSIPYHFVSEQAHLVPFNYQARVDYLKIVDMLYF